MTTYHFEHRVPRKGERFLSDMNVRYADTSVFIDTSNGGAVNSRYVFTEDRPRGEHPEALLIRVNGELYGRTYVSASNQPVYTSVNDCANFQYASDITEWEDVYDEAPAPGPAWPDPPVIVIEEGEQTGLRVATLPAVAIRMTGTPFADTYRDEAGSLWHPGEDTITAWHEYVPDGYVPQEKVYEAAAQGAAAAAPEARREYTTDELDNLPEGTCVWDEDGDVWQQRGSSWLLAGGPSDVQNPLREALCSNLYSAPLEGH